MSYENEKLKEFNEYIRFRKVGIIGLGVSNIPLIDYMHEKQARVTVFDEREIDNIPKEIMDKITNYGFEFSFGKNCLEKLKNFDIIFRSPSCLPTRKELAEEEEISKNFDGVSEVIFNFEEVKYMSSSGIRVLVGNAKHLAILAASRLSVFIRLVFVIAIVVGAIILQSTLCSLS